MLSALLLLLERLFSLSATIILSWKFSYLVSCEVVCLDLIATIPYGLELKMS